MKAENLIISIQSNRGKKASACSMQHPTAIRKADALILRRSNKQPLGDWHSYNIWHSLASSKDAFFNVGTAPPCFPIRIRRTKAIGYAKQTQIWKCLIKACTFSSFLYIKGFMDSIAKLWMHYFFNLARTTCVWSRKGEEQLNLIFEPLAPEPSNLISSLLSCDLRRSYLSIITLPSLHKVPSCS